MLILGGLEMLIVFILAVWGFARPGPGGFTFSVFDISKKLSVEASRSRWCSPSRA